jgi:hypothetical protein
MAKLHTVADVQTVQEVIIKLRGTVAISRDYPQGGEVNRLLVNTTIAAWAEEMASALKAAPKDPPVAPTRIAKHRAG